MKKGLKKISFLLYFATAVVIMFTLQASAYLEPSVVSYGLQALIGIVVAGGAFFVVWWRKLRKKVTKTLGIDENAGKQVEEDVVLTDETANDKDIPDAQTKI